MMNMIAQIGKMALSFFKQCLPLGSEDLETSMLILSCQKILKGIVSDYQNHLQDTVIFSHMEHGIQFCYSEEITNLQLAIENAVENEKPYSSLTLS
ncbi:hypothetical protein OUZ56_020532 [Daphnia magna]|uniref:Uncharacterized protein n=1 Tax=Daphnia magna TaxID=35525 RepID=A0ABQ9ZER2_9CRUS|nr:hypothetical protein OUZ56_020532 [Daphnia magna]